MEILLPFALAVVLLLISAFFSAAETAFLSLQPVQLRRLKAERPILAAQIERLLAEPRRLFNVLLLADSCANLPLILLCLWLMRQAVPSGFPFFAGSLAIFGLIVILGHLVPKMIALRAPFRIVSAGAPLLRLTLPLLEPVSRVLDRASDWMARVLTPRSFASSPLDEEELETLVEMAAEDGAVTPGEGAILTEILKLGEKSAKDCMLPRTDVFSIPDDLDLETVVEKLRVRRFRRVPVYADTPDQILGILDVGSFLLRPGEGHYTERLTPPSYVPETMNALELLRGFLRHPQRLAVVVDEFGGTAGIVTLPDILEHLIPDALPSADQGLYIEPFGAGRLIVAGTARLDDLGRKLGEDLEEEGIDTIGGLVFTRLGYLPKPGETLELGRYRVMVRRASRKRIQEMLIEPMETTEPHPDAESAEPEENPGLEGGESSGTAS